MSQVPQRKISFTAGQTFIDQTLWCQGARVYKQVSDIVYGLPTVVKVVGHGIPVGVVIAIWFENMSSQAFKSGTPYFATAVDSDYLTITDHNSAGIKPASLGSIFYIPPIDTSGFLVVAMFKRSTSAAALLTLRSDGVSPGFTLPETGIIQLELTPANTKTLIGANKNPITGLAQVEVTNNLGKIFRPWNYEWSAYPEGTTE